MISCYIFPGQGKGLTLGKGGVRNSRKCWKYSAREATVKNQFPPVLKGKQNMSHWLFFSNKLKTYKPQKSKACVILSVVTTLKSNSLWKLPHLDFSTYDTICSNYYYGSLHNQLDVYTGFGIFTHVSSPSLRLGISFLMVLFLRFRSKSKTVVVFLFSGPHNWVWDLKLIS